MYVCMQGVPCSILRLLTQQNVVLRYSNLDADVSVATYSKKTFAPFKEGFTFPIHHFYIS